MKSILVIYNGHIYDITKFISKHPGEGINNNYLINYNRKDITEDFNKNHYTDKPYDIINNVKKNTFDKINNIYYVCPNFFKLSNCIPKYFHYNLDDIYSEKFMLNKPDKYFVLRKSHSEPNSCIYLTYRLNLKTKHLKIERINNQWVTQWIIQGLNYIEEIKYNNLEDLIKHLIENKGLIYNI